MSVSLFLCYCHCDVYVFVVRLGFLLRSWKVESIILSNFALIAVCIYCHVTFQYCAYSNWISYNSSFSFFLQYKNLISWFNLYLFAAFLVFPFFLLFPLILMLKYFGVSCLVLQYFVNLTFVFSNFNYQQPTMR
jgi:hypothetical protein